MSLTPEEIENEMSRLLAVLTKEKGKDWADKIRPILSSNLDRGRIGLYIEGNLDRLPEYIERVAAQYSNLSAYIHEIQTERTGRLWEPLFERMQIWAFNFLIRKGFEADASTQEIAAECAADAAAMLLKAYFPYDTDFDPWAHVIVQNACRKFIRAGLKKSNVPEESLLALDENLRAPADPPLGTFDSSNDRETELLDAISKLPEARRQVVELVYFEGLSPDEAATRMGKSVGAIYSLQFNALEELRKILSRIGNTLND